MDISDIKARLAGEVDYGAWHRLNSCAFNQGWIGPEAHGSNVYIINDAENWNRPDLLIPVALSMVPEGWYWQSGRTTLYEGWANVYATHPNNTEPGKTEFSRNAQYPAAAIALAVIEARTK